MHWLTSVFGKLNNQMGRMNNRTMMMSLVALGVGVGATAIGMARQRRMGNRFQQLLDPVRKMF